MRLRLAAAGAAIYTLAMPRTQPIFLWQRAVTPAWLTQNEERLQLATGGDFAVVEQVNRKHILVQACCVGRAAARDVVAEFGGSVEKLPQDWLPLFAAVPPKPLRIGRRLVVTSGEDVADLAPSPLAALRVPAGAAFGTGDHATTAMSLRILERVTRRLPPGWRMFDAGTGSGILALAAKRFGAGRVMAIDNDPLAIATAKQNARLNGLRAVKFFVGDITVVESAESFDIITANLYSELLESVLPRFRRELAPDGRLILSGVLGRQEPKLTRALRRNGFGVLEARRRGKWVALLASSSSPRAPARARSRSRAGGGSKRPKT
jgi:ribosomal protein L11 methyltransferase